jgi:crossover junction endodeoxyribonuclease RuvC
MRVLGVDPGTIITGYGVVDVRSGKPNYVTHGVIKTTPKQPLWERIQHIHLKMVEIALEHRPDVLAIERCFVSRNVQSALKLGHTRGVIIVAGMNAGASIAEYTPTEVKNAVTGYGRAEKHQVAQMVKMILSLQETPQADAADALAVALTHTFGIRARAAMGGTR